MNQPLEQKTYTRAELEALFGTDRIDSIKRSLERAGYSYESTGRGRSLTITITKLPAAFEAFAKREFSCGAQTNFTAMKKHFYLLLNHPDYQYLPSNHQAKYLEEHYGIQVADQSLRNWQKFLIQKNWLAKDSGKARYYLCRSGQPPKEITQEEYRKIWVEFYDRKEKGGTEADLRGAIISKYGGIPRKQYGLTENALEREIIEELQRILLDTS